MLTSIASPTFNNIASGEMSLQEIVPTLKSGEDVEDGNVSFQELDEYGEAGEMYIYNPSGKQGAGWYPISSPKKLAEFVFDFGKGLVLSSEYEDAQFTFSGEVNMIDNAIPVDYLTSVFGNTRPTQLDMQEIIPSLLSGEDVEDGNISFQELDEYGEAGEMYIYNPSGKQGAGWYPISSPKKLAEFVFEPGQALVLSSEYEDAVLEIPDL